MISFSEPLQSRKSNIKMQMTLGRAILLSFMYACSIYIRWRHFHLELLQLQSKTLLRSKWDSFACAHPALISIIHTYQCNVFHLQGMHLSLDLGSLLDETHYAFTLLYEENYRSAWILKVNVPCTSKIKSLQIKVKPGTLKHNNKTLKFKKTYFMETISMSKDEFFALVVLIIWSSLGQIMGCEQG